jgi:hypothetical protein
MRNTIRLELLGYLKDLINDGVLTDDNQDEWHYEAFNADYYIVGYYNAEQWLKRHDVIAFEAIADCLEYELNTCGEVTLKPEDINAEKIVNLYAYIKGEELLNDLRADSIDELMELINEDLED